MAFWKRTPKPAAPQGLTRVSIQATEGSERTSVYQDSLGWFLQETNPVAGTYALYTSHDSQVRESYSKYNGYSSWGCPQLRAVVDIRSAFIAGEGLSFSTSSDRHRLWLEEFRRSSPVLSSGFLETAIGSELLGRVLFVLRLPKEPGGMPKAIRVPYLPDLSWKAILSDRWDPDSVTGIQLREGLSVRMLSAPAFVYVKTGGDDATINETTTRVGVVLNEFENYDRALKDLRLNNHVGARITPDLKVETAEQAEDAAADFAETNWKIGKMRIGTGEFSYKTPGTGASESLKSEMSTTLKTISSITGVPVHWIGWADLLSNRSTADSLYDTISNATIRDREKLAGGVKDLIVKAQEIYINLGGTMISKVDTDFDVQIPVVDRGRFLELARALSLAYGDGAISMEDYRNALPGIDPMQTERTLAAEKAKEPPAVLPTNPQTITAPPTGGPEGV